MNNLLQLGTNGHTLAAVLIDLKNHLPKGNHDHLYEKVVESHHGNYAIEKLAWDILEAFDTDQPYAEPVTHQCLMVLDEIVPGLPTHIVIDCIENVPSRGEFTKAIRPSLKLTGMSFTVQKQGDRWIGTIYEDGTDTLFDYCLYEIR